jgi:hypothetical protein
MTKPTEEQVSAASELIKSHYRQYGNAASETRLASLVYSIYSTLTGDGKPAEEHANALELARQEEKAAAAEPEVTDDTDGAAPASAPESGDTVNNGDGQTGGSDPAASEGTDPADDEDEAEEYTREELEAMTVEQLKELAEEGELSFAAKITKPELIDLILSA